jgi:hypothetical protein
VSFSVRGGAAHEHGDQCSTGQEGMQSRLEEVVSRILFVDLASGTLLPPRDRELYSVERNERSPSMGVRWLSSTTLR